MGIRVRLRDADKTILHYQDAASFAWYPDENLMRIQDADGKTVSMLRLDMVIASEYDSQAVAVAVGESK